jgi:hypothetical protein
MRRKSQPVAKSRMCNRGTNILGIKSCLPIRWASSAPRIVVGSQESRDPFPGDLVRARRRDAGQRSLARSGLFIRSLCARDPIQGGKHSRNLICPGSGIQPTPDPSDRWPESLEEERLLGLPARYHGRCSHSPHRCTEALPLASAGAACSRNRRPSLSP